jgi:hypothetical protein
LRVVLVAVPLLADLRGLARDVRETPVRAASVDPLLLGLAAKAELVERDGDTLLPGDDVEWLDLTEGAAALDAWDYAFAQVLRTDQSRLRALRITGRGCAMCRLWWQRFARWRYAVGGVWPYLRPGGEGAEFGAGRRPGPRPRRWQARS